jgi:hypothetical protein
MVGGGPAYAYFTVAVWWWDFFGGQVGTDNAGAESCMIQRQTLSGWKA